ncbi:MAG: hypothetical protein HYS20_00010 [Rhodocyclales bacterium]|nr:hypothetical protein [Rhodocyclales bacterium]
MTKPQLAISLTRPAPIGWATSEPGERSSVWSGLLDDAELGAWIASLAPTHLYFGSEFCEHLLPGKRTLQAGIDLAQQHQLQFALLTPIASPQVLRDLHNLLPLLPPSSEVIVNDWGVARLLRESFPGLRACAGRILCRMIKDPRLGGPEWAAQCNPAIASSHFQAILGRLGLARLEIDVPIFAYDGAFASTPLPVSVHLPYAYVAKGRSCRPGSMSITGPERFAPGRKCKKECLTLTATTTRPHQHDRWPTRHTGNTIYSRHTNEMLAAVRAACEAGQIDRVIVPGEPA